MEKNRHLVLTKDGSPTLFVPELDEHYHSIHGALQESLHVFINAGLQFLLDKGLKSINVFEVGFGTGLNALLSNDFAQQNNINIHYESLEDYPLALEEASVISDSLELTEDQKNFFQSMHEAVWNKPVQLNEHFSLHKRQEKLQEYKISNSADVIFFDAFAPSAQPQLWEEAIFQKMYEQLKLNGILVTYCAKGVVKRRLKACGFEVEAIPGPPGKREMTRALKH